MNNYSETDRGINLKDLLYRTLKEWRMIIAIAIIVALTAALYQTIMGLRIILDDEAMAKAEEKYEISLADYEATGEQFRTRIDNLRAQSANQQEYNDKSELMKIDPMNKWVGSLQFYIDSKYQIDPNLTYQTPDLTNRLISAYSGYLHSGTLYGEIISEVRTVDEIRFLSEIYKVGSDPGAATITVSVVGKSEEDIHRLLDFIKQKVTERFETIRSTIGEHDVDVLSESVYAVIDLSLDEQQKTNLLAISEYANSIGEADRALTEWSLTSKPFRAFGAKYTIRQTVKFLILGGIIGFVAAFCWLTVKYILSNTVKTEEDWKAYRIPVLGTLFREQRKKKLDGIDRWIDRLFDRQHAVTLEQDCTLTARSVGAALRQQGVKEAMLVGNVESPQAESLTQKMDAVAPEYALSFAGNVLTDPNASEKLEKATKVVLLIQNQTTCFRDINQTLTLLKTWGKSILGVIVVE